MSESTPGITLTISEGALASLASAIRDYSAQEEQRGRFEMETHRAERQAYVEREERTAHRDALLRQEQDARVAASGKDLLTFLLAERAKQDDFRTQVLGTVLGIFETFYALKLKQAQAGDESPSAPPSAAHAASEDEGEEDEDATARPDPDFDAWASGGGATKDEDKE